MFWNKNSTELKKSTEDTVEKKQYEQKLTITWRDGTQSWWTMTLDQIESVEGNWRDFIKWFHSRSSPTFTMRYGAKGVEKSGLMMFRRKDIKNFYIDQYPKPVDNSND